MVDPDMFEEIEDEEPTQNDEDDLSGPVIIAVVFLGVVMVCLLVGWLIQLYHMTGFS